MESGLSVETAVKKWIHRFAARDREVYVGAIRAALEVKTIRKNLLLASPVLADEAPKIW